MLGGGALKHFQDITSLETTGEEKVFGRMFSICCWDTRVYKQGSKNATGGDSGTPLSLKFTLSKHTLLANALSKFSFWTLNSFSPLSTLKKTQLFISKQTHTSYRHLATSTRPPML